MKEFLQDLSKNLSLKDRVYNILKEQIINGNLQPGTHLNELELSSAMKISRGPIREALSMLEREGFAATSPRRGTEVASLTFDDTKDIWEMRKLIEPYAGKIAMECITEDELNILDEKLKEIDENPDDFVSYMNTDMEIHELISKHIKSNLLKEILNMVKEHSLRARYYSEESAPTPKDVIKKGNREHMKILKQIRKRDGQGVVDAITEHINNSEIRTLSALGKTPV